MTQAAADVSQSLITAFGPGRAWTTDGFSATVWKTKPYHILWSDSKHRMELQKIWNARSRRTTDSVVLLAASEIPSNVLVVGPQNAKLIRDLTMERVLNLLANGQSLSVRKAAAYLTSEFARLEESVVPGLHVKDLLTPYFVRERMRRYERDLAAPAKGARRADGANWRSLFVGLGYNIEQRRERGYLLRHDGSPIAVVHLKPEPSSFGRLTDDGQLPEGMVLADCKQDGAHWGILASQGRYRMFQRKPQTGPATTQYIEIDANELGQESWLYVGLFAPESLRDGGNLARWAREAKDFGEELRKGLEQRLIKTVLPSIARGLGEHLRSKGANLDDRRQLRSIQEAALTIVFRFMFLLHVEARGYLPTSSMSYRPHSARQIAKDSMVQQSSLDPKSTNYWDRLRALTKMIRTGNKISGVPAYNGGLFAEDGFPGSELLEHADIADTYLAPALAAIAYDREQSTDSALDYAGLQIGHLGAIYERLLTMRLTRAMEDLAYGPKGDKYVPARRSEKPSVCKGELCYQPETGGRKAGGVFYTRHEFVERLLVNSLLPALEKHLQEVEKVAKQDKTKAAAALFDFSVVDPAMGSAHFLTVALDMMADSVDMFLAKVGLPDIKHQLDKLRMDGERAVRKIDDGERAVRKIDDGDLLRRLILKQCIYGVDVSPMAVEIASVTLWLASFVPGLALSYLGSNLKCGNALIGVVDLSVVRSADRLFNGGQYVVNTMAYATQLQTKQASISDSTPDDVSKSKELDTKLRKTTDRLRLAFHMWTAEPLGLSNNRLMLEMHGQEIIENGKKLADDIINALDKTKLLAKQYNFFHWPLEFPHIFHRKNPGFDVVTGNPPWEEVTVNELDFYALRDPGLRGLVNLNDRKKRMAELDRKNPTYGVEFMAEKRKLSVIRTFFSRSGDYQLQGVGDTDMYQLFCERYTHVIRHGGHLGVVLPRSAFLAAGAKGFRSWLFTHSRQPRLDFILNKTKWAFPDVHGQYSIALLAGQRDDPEKRAKVRIVGPVTSLQKFHSMGTTETNVRVSSMGDSRIVPLVPSRKHASILAKIRRGIQFDAMHPPPDAQDSEIHPSSPFITPYSEIHETNGRNLFPHSKSGKGRLPVWKGRSFGQYDPHGRLPIGYCGEKDILQHLQKKWARSPKFKKLFASSELVKPDNHPILDYRIAFRDSTNRTNSRTVIACLMPPRTPLTNTAPYLVFGGWSRLEQSYVLGILNSTSFNWLARRYVELHVNFHILNILCFPAWKSVPWQRIGELAARLSCVDDRYAEFASETGVECGPIDNDERDGMRAQIDVLVARAYGLTKDDMSFIFEDFTEKAIDLAYRELVLSKFANGEE